MNNSRVAATAQTILDRMETLDGFLEHMLSTAFDQSTELASSEGMPATAKDLAGRSSASIVVAQDFREQLAAELDKLREALAEPALAA